MRAQNLFVTAVAILAGSASLVAIADDRETTAPVPSQANANPDSEVYRASEVIGLTVNDDSGQKVGQIKDLVINGASREVLYAVVALNQAKEKDVVYVMPWSIFQPSFGRGQVLQYTVINVPQTVWIQAPYWTQGDWRQASFNQWAPRVDKYFANHVQATSSNRASTYRVNKPALNGNQGSPAPKSDGGTDKKNNPGNATKDKNEKPAAGGAPSKPNDSSKNPEKKGSDRAEKPTEKSPKLPAPKDPDPADPKDPPRDEKPAPKNPK